MNKNLQELKNELDTVGCGFCLAKWTQVTMHLHNGTTHSCHHPTVHKVPLDEIANNPTALHNTIYKKSIRKEMLENKKPSECNYCWNIEKSSDSFSDRVFKSSESWSLPFFNEVKKLDYDTNFNPKYVEVNFSNTCNFKCSYCGPMFSSKWMEEIDTHGSYPLSYEYNDLNWIKETNHMPYKHSEENPYVESFWKWWPNLYNDLHTFRITGGEPLLSKDTWKILDFLETTETPNRNLNISINTNLGSPKSLIEKFVISVKKIIEENRVNEFIIFTSCESFGEQAEYIRNGLNFELFFENIEYILKELPTVTINVMATFNALSVFKYDMLIDRIFELKRKYQNNKRYWISPIQLDTSYLRFPSHLSIKILDEEHKKLIYDAAVKMLYYGSREFTHEEYGFSNTEIQKVKRTYDYAISNDNFDVEKNRKDFVKFVDEHDKRRGTNFLKTFPELEKLYTNVKNRI